MDVVEFDSGLCCQKERCLLKWVSDPHSLCVRVYVCVGC